jgi:RHS repeat-associated protein
MPSKYKYNGKEWQDELGLNMTAMDFRQYDNAIGRFNCTDPITHYSESPYHFASNNPVYFNDPTGLDYALDWASNQAYLITSLGSSSNWGESDVDRSPIDYIKNFQNETYSTSDKSVIAGIYNTYAVQNGYSRIWHPATFDANPEFAGLNQMNELGAINLGYWEDISSYFGRTDTFKIGDEYTLFSSGLGDEISRIDYAGHISGKEGKLITVDNSYTNKSYDGSSITLGLLTLGFGTDVSVSAGLGLFGTEGHLGLGIGNGLGQISYGYSHSSDGTIKGSDTTVKVGAGTLAAAAFIYLTGGFGVLAF